MTDKLTLADWMLYCNPLLNFNKDLVNDTRKFERFDCSLSIAERDLTDFLRDKSVDIDGYIKLGKAVKE